MVEAGKEYLFIDGDNDISADRIVPGPHTDIGAELRATREARGLEIAPVAQDLRIREQYLRSLESGSYDDLPGAAYAIGFVRSYAKYLHLDAADMVRRFKAEVKGTPHGDKLAFPQPVRYGRLPGVTLVAASILVAGLLYGGWYLYSAKQNDALSARTTADGAAATRGGAAGPGNVAADAAGKKAADAAVGAGNAKATGMTAAGKKTGTAAIAKTGPDAAPDADVAAKRDGKRDADAGKSTDGASKDPSVGRSATTSGAPPADAPPAGASAEKKASSQVAALPKDNRIVLRATANVWVQIKDQGNRVVFVKVLRAGDSFTVPKQDGLIMNVGNAGGLQIVVGGAPIKSLGPTNIPVFNVSLDPRALLEHRR